MRSADDVRVRAALEDLCRDYWYPLYAYLRRRGLDSERAADVVQGFFARLIEKRDFGELAPERGRFRAFLLAALQHHLSHEREREHAQKRGGGRAHVSIDPRDADSRFQLEARGELSPEGAFERAWALDLLARVLELLRVEYAEDGKAALFERIRPAIQGGELADVPRLARELGMSEGAVKVAGTRLRRRYGERLRAAIADTVEDPADVEDELRALLAALAAR
ncbi:MAG: sigma-70 family RNA polymerase sigma factor [Planctomycetes bacterium]|nr:sigma-70 family RNA polymerase sigma factor [Planctomycetota bacterium]